MCVRFCPQLVPLGLLMSVTKITQLVIITWFGVFQYCEHSPTRESTVQAGFLFVVERLEWRVPVDAGRGCRCRATEKVGRGRRLQVCLR